LIPEELKLFASERRRSPMTSIATMIVKMYRPRSKGKALLFNIWVPPDR
jgi:hypothetical protein